MTEHTVKKTGQLPIMTKHTLNISSLPWKLILNKNENFYTNLIFRTKGKAIVASHCIAKRMASVAISNSGMEEIGGRGGREDDATRVNSASWVQRLVVNAARCLIKKCAVKWFDSVCRKRTFQEVEEEAVKGNGGNEPNNVQNAERQQMKKARKEKDVPSSDIGLSPSVTPVQLAKDYMGARWKGKDVPSWDIGLSPSVTPIQIAKDYMGAQSRTHFRVPDRSKRCQLFQDEPTAYKLIPRTTVGGCFGNGHVEDRSKTTSNRLNGLQYRRARNRVQRLNYTSFVRNSCQQDMGNGTPISTQWTPIQSSLAGGRQILKKRSRSVLDDGVTLADPIRSTQQKTSFYTPFIECQVSLQTGETISKILEHLARVEPEKTVEAQVAIARSKPPTQLNLNNGRSKPGSLLGQVSSSAAATDSAIQHQVEEVSDSEDEPSF